MMPPVPMTILRQNLHNHTTLSDGCLTPTQLVEAAQAAGLEGIGISDHFFTQKIYRLYGLGAYLEEYWPRYLREARQAKAAAPPGLKVWVGAEIDACFERIGVDLPDLPWNEINTLDYVLFEYIGEFDQAMPINRLGSLRKYCHIPIIMAHPNLDALEEQVPLEMFFEILSLNRIALELPGGTRNPWPWAKRDPGSLKRAHLTIGTDTHDCREDVGNIDKVLAFLKAHDLTQRLVDPDSPRIATGGPK